MRSDTRTSDDYEPLVIFNPDGSERKCSVFKRRDPLRATMTMAAARDGLGSGQAVWVSPVDAPALRLWWEGRRG